MIKTLMVSAVLCLTGGAMAQEADTGFHLGLGYTNYDREFSDFPAITLRGGYDFSQYFGVEAEYHHALEKHKRQALITAKSYSKLEQAYGAFFKARYPVLEGVTLHARAGWSHVKIETERYLLQVAPDLPTVWQKSSAPTRSFTSDGFAYGVGAEWNFWDQNSLRFDYTRHTIDNFDDDQSLSCPHEKWRHCQPRQPGWPRRWWPRCRGLRDFKRCGDDYDPRAGQGTRPRHSR